MFSRTDHATGKTTYSPPELPAIEGTVTAMPAPVENLPPKDVEQPDPVYDQPTVLRVLEHLANVRETKMKEHGAGSMAYAYADDALRQVENIVGLEMKA